MNLRGPLAAALAAVLLAAAPRQTTLTAYSAPAALRPAGASSTDPADAVLPDGRIAAPLGQTNFVGTNPMGVALSPDGRFAIVVNDEQDPNPPSTAPAQSADLAGGFSLSVLDARTMRVVSVYHENGVAFSDGIASVADPQDPTRTLVLASDGAHDLVRVFDLNDGTLTPEPKPVQLPPHDFPTTIAVSGDGRTAFVADDLGDNVATIDLSSRSFVRTAAVGYYPHGLAVAGSRIFVSNEGLSQYSAISPVRAPQFGAPSSDPSRASSMMILDGDNASVVRMDPVPDGVTNVGGAHPSSVVARRDGAYAYVALSGVDRIATVALDGVAHVVGGLDLRLFVDAPYGTQPGAQVLSPDGKRLYVTLAGLNAVAVLDASTPVQLHRLGLIPTGWYPSALALSPDARYLYVTSAKGVDGWGQLQRIDLKSLPLMKSTLSALRYNRTASVARANGVMPPLGSESKSSVIDRVVYISLGSGTFDAFLGDLGRGNGDPSLAAYGASATPNLHALAKTYAIADNFYVDDLRTDANILYGVGALTTVYTQRTLGVNAGRAPYDAHGEDPENYPRAGYLFNGLAREGLAYRDYGGLLSLSGYVPTISSNANHHAGRANDPSGFGGLYSLDVPGLAALDQHIDVDYAGWNPQITDAARADEFIRDMGSLVQSDQQPAFTYVWLPAAGADGAAGADRALGRIIEFLSHTPHWSSTAVFITADGVGDTRDHVNAARTYALVVSPLAKAAYTGHLHLSPASIVKTEEELLGLKPLGLFDLLATDMADFFGEVPYPNTYQAIP